MHPVTRPSFPGSTKSIMHEAQKVSERAPCCRPALRRKVASLEIWKDGYHNKIKSMSATEVIILSASFPRSPVEARHCHCPDKRSF